MSSDAIPTTSFSSWSCSLLAHRPPRSVGTDGSNLNPPAHSHRVAARTRRPRRPLRWEPRAGRNPEAPAAPSTTDTPAPHELDVFDHPPGARELLTARRAGVSVLAGVASTRFALAKRGFPPALVCSDGNRVREPGHWPGVAVGCDPCPRRLRRCADAPMRYRSSHQAMPSVRHCASVATRQAELPTICVVAEVLAVDRRVGLTATLNEEQAHSTVDAPHVVRRRYDWKVGRSEGGHPPRGYRIAPRILTAMSRQAPREELARTAVIPIDHPEQLPSRSTGSASTWFAQRQVLRPTQEDSHLRLIAQFGSARVRPGSNGQL